MWHRVMNGLDRRGVEMGEQGQVMPRRVVEWFNMVLGHQYDAGIVYKDRESALKAVSGGDRMLYVSTVYIVFKRNHETG